MILAIVFFIVWLLAAIFWIKASLPDPIVPILVMAAIGILGWAHFGQFLSK